MPFFTALLLVFAFLFLPQISYAQSAIPIDGGNTAWLLVCSALVMLMTPGLAFFYAGMVNRKNVVSTLLQNYMALGVVGVLWVMVGYSLAFADGSAWLGGLGFAFLDGLSGDVISGGIPHLAFVAFEMMFAVIAPALISGAIAERVNFGAWVLMLGLWSLAVYAPVAHWVWGPGGWIAADGGLDFAGGLVVHITAGVAALVAALMFGRRIDADAVTKPADISMIMLGAALLWFGWFGFNAGSALAADGLAAHAFMTTFVGAACAFLAWMAVDYWLHGKAGAVGAAIGLVVGLVVITPAAGFVSIPAAMLMCAIGGGLCNIIAHWLKTKTMLDDTLDVFACHGVGGMLGAVMTGLFASSAVNPAVEVQGLLVSGEWGLLWANSKGVLAVTTYTAIVTFGLIKLVSFITPIRVAPEAEDVGLDSALHGESMDGGMATTASLVSNKAA